MMIGGSQGCEDYDRANALIAAESEVPYVLVRPAALNNKDGKGTCKAFRSGGTFAKPIPRQDLPPFSFDAMSEGTWNGGGGIQVSGS